MNSDNIKKYVFHHIYIFENRTEETAGGKRFYELTLLWFPKLNSALHLKVSGTKTHKNTPKSSCD